MHPVKLTLSGEENLLKFCTKERTYRILDCIQSCFCGKRAKEFSDEEVKQEQAHLNEILKLVPELHEKVIISLSWDSVYSTFYCSFNLKAVKEDNKITIAWGDIELKDPEFKGVFFRNTYKDLMKGGELEDAPDDFITTEPGALESAYRLWKQMKLLDYRYSLAPSSTQQKLLDEDPDMYFTGGSLSGETREIAAGTPSALIAAIEGLVGVEEVKIEFPKELTMEISVVGGDLEEIAKTICFHKSVGIKLIGDTIQTVNIGTGYYTIAFNYEIFKITENPEWNIFGNTDFDLELDHDVSDSDGLDYTDTGIEDTLKYLEGGWIGPDTIKGTLPTPEDQGYQEDEVDMDKLNDFFKNGF